MDIASTVVSESKDAALSRVVLLHDKTGRIQVILPQHAMLDLKSIQSETGRELVAVSQIEVDELYASQRLSQLIKFGELHSVTTIVDESVFAEQLHLAPLVADETDSSAAATPVTIQLEELTQALLASDHDVLSMKVAVDEHELTTSTPNSDSNADPPRPRSRFPSIPRSNRPPTRLQSPVWTGTPRPGMSRSRGRRRPGR